MPAVHWTWARPALSFFSRINIC